MDLPTLFASSEPAEKLYLAIVLTEKYVQSAVWKFDQGKVVTVERSDKHPYTDDKDCVIQTDLSLQELGKESESANEVVFGLEPSWVTQAGVSDLRKPLLKKITQDLSLKAVGFVVIGEAVFQHLVKTQAFLTALLLELQETELRVSLVKQGKILASERVGRSGDTAADLAEGLARFGKATPALAQLPSRVILYSYQLTEDELANEEQTILHHDWVTDQTFLQPPLIEIISPTTLLDAVVTEGGAALGSSLGMATSPSAEAVPQEEFGFHQVQQPRQGESVGKDEMQANVVPVATSFGVPIAPERVAGPRPAGMTATVAARQPTASAKEPSMAHGPGLRLPKLSLPGLRSGGAHRPFILAGFGLGLLVLLIGGYLFLRFTAKALVAIELRKETISREVALTLDPAAQTASETTLPVTRVTREVQGSKLAPTTGVKLVGDKAKGKVTLFNKTTAAKTFTAGTVLTSGNYEFTLDQEVTVASASVTTSGNTETKTFGEGQVSVTAAEIGAESNLPKGTNFRVANFDESTYAANNPEALTGGSSREVRVASEQDAQKLLADLRTELLANAEAEFSQQADGDSQLAPSGKITIQSTTYNAKVGDEVNDLKLDVVALIEAYAYQNDQLQPLAEQLLSSQVPPNYELIKDKIQILSDAQLEGASSSSKVTLQANLSAEAQPQIDATALKTELEGQTLVHLASILGSKPEVSSYEVSFMPSVARGILRALPRGDRLTIELK